MCRFVCFLLIVFTGCIQQQLPVQQAAQWQTIDWTFNNPSHDGNPFDLIAAAAFVHEATAERRFSHLFYTGNQSWVLRFTPTQPGRWTFQTVSDDPELNNLSGSVDVTPDPAGRGFVTSRDGKWAWSGTGRAFVPQVVMAAEPDRYAADPDRLDRDIQTFIKQHGFNGLHIPVKARWFDLAQDASTAINDPDPNPDFRTFEILEQIIRRVYAAGGMVHFWVWGDDQRNQTPVKWGINGVADKRLQRYIAARLGPLPGWSMGYGFDLWEWVSGEQLSEWHEFMHQIFGWPHLLGARPGGATRQTMDQLTEKMDYASYEQHRPDYDMYVRTIEARPAKPAFSEDRFRVRNEPRYVDKDYTYDMTRRGLWHSTMAGGVANIWGHLPDGRSSAEGSAPYPNAHQIKTWALFFQNRFTVDLVRDNDRTDGVCLRDPGLQRFIMYREDATSVRVNLSGVTAALPAIAVDTKKPYQEISLTDFPNGEYTWKAPYQSDWALAIGDFSVQSAR